MAEITISGVHRTQMDTPLPVFESVLGHLVCPQGAAVLPKEQHFDADLRRSDDSASVRAYRKLQASTASFSRTPAVRIVKTRARVPAAQAGWLRTTSLALKPI